MPTLLDFRKRSKIQDPISNIRKSRGFTLIELLVVVGIIGILTALGAVSYSAAQLRARDTQRKSDVAVYQSALECYFAANHRYPNAPGDTQAALESAGCTRETPAFTDPKTGNRYTIIRYTNSNLQNQDSCGNTCYYYRLIACLENANDPQKDQTRDGTNCSAANGYPVSTYPASYTVRAP